MRKYLQITLAILCLAVIPATAAQAYDIDIRPYAGNGFGAFGLELKGPGFSQKSTVFGGFEKLGVDIGDYLGTELRIGATSIGTQSNPAGTLGVPVPFDTKLSSNYFLSYLVKIQSRESAGMRVYALVGATTARLKGALPVAGLSVSTSRTKTGFSYGFGINYHVQDSLTVGGEWMQYWTNVNVDPNVDAKMWGATANAAYHF